VASCRAALSKGMEYDRGAAEEAKQKFEEFVKEHPDASLSEEAEKNIGVLREKEAESGFNIGRFYEKQGQLEAAKIYYNEVMTNFDTSSWAAKASERLEIVEKMLEKKNAKKKK
jgi:outer membrane protein assembly factor BamD